MTDGWSFTPLGAVLSHRKERGHNDDPLLSVTRDAGIIMQSAAGRRNISSDNKGAYWRIYPDDIAYNTMRMWQGVSGRSSHYGIVSPAYTVLQPNDQHDSRYLAYLLKQPSLIRLFQSKSQGLTSDVWNLKYSAFAKIIVECPPHSEQRRIAEILDTIDDAIRKTEQVIAKLQQMKQGLLNDLLTRGIDKNGELRDPKRNPEQFKESSLGQLPAGWKVAEFAWCLNGLPQNGLYKPLSSYGDTGTPIVRIDGFHEGVLTPISSLKRLQVTSAEVKTYGLEQGDVLINRVNSIDIVGKVALVPELAEPVVFESNMMRCRLRADLVNSEFIIHWLMSPWSRNWFHRRAKSAIAQASINQMDVKKLLIAVPSLNEQKQLVERGASGGKRLVSEQLYLDKLRFMKSGLMDDLFTGRVRVIVPVEKAS